MTSLDLATRLRADRAYAAAPGTDPYSVAARARAAARVLRDEVALAELLVPHLDTTCTTCSTRIEAGHEGTLECECQRYGVEAGVLLVVDCCRDCGLDQVLAYLVGGRCPECAELYEEREARRLAEEAYESWCDDEGDRRRDERGTYADELYYAGGSL